MWSQAFSAGQRLLLASAALGRHATGAGAAILALSGAVAGRAESRLELYPDTPGIAAEDRVEGTVGGRHLTLGRRRVWHADSAGEHFIEVASARFAADGPVTVRLRGKADWPDGAVVRARGRDLPARRAGASLEVELPAAGQYYLSLPGLALSNGTFTVVFWVDDLRRLEEMRFQCRAAGVVDIAREGVRPDPERDQTAALQALLDRRGTLYVPPGVYRTGSLHLRSSTTIVFAPGAVLRALDTEAAVGPEFISIDGARDVKLCGPGVLDANSLARRRGHNVHHVNITGSRNVTFEDLLFEQSNSWAVHIRKSDGFTARNVKIFSGKDGFDPDSSRDVLIDGAFVVAGDDAVAVKNRFPEEPGGKTTERIGFRNSIVCTTKSALKVGTETRGPIRDVCFEGCDVFDGDRGIVLYARDGGPIERVVWRDIRLFMINWPQEKESGAVFDVTVENRAAPTPVRDCLIENVSANWIFRSRFAGLADAPLTGVTLRNIQARVQSPKSGKPALFLCGDNVNLELKGMAVDWQGHEAEWDGVVTGKGITILQESTAADKRSATKRSERPEVSR